MSLTSRLRPLVAVANLVKEPPLQRMSAPEVRRQLGFFQATVGRFVRSTNDVSVSNLELALDGRTVRTRVARPKSASNGLVVYYHGGGWVAGDLDSHDKLCRCLAAESGATVVSVDYRLAPEHRFPAAADDAFDAARELATRAERLGAPADRVFVAGDSAGGNLAAVTAQRARDAGLALRGQLLVYPVIAPDFESPSYRASAEGYVLSRDRMRYFWETYAPDKTSWTDARIAPLAGSLAELAPALVITAEHDVLRSEGERYAKALADAGVAVEHVDVPGMIHGFVTLQGVVPEAAQVLGRMAAFVRGR